MNSLPDVKLCILIFYFLIAFAIFMILFGFAKKKQVILLALVAIFWLPLVIIVVGVNIFLRSGSMNIELD